jgi:type II restriction enzyme
MRRKSSDNAEKIASISTQQLARIALVCSNKPNYPLHVDRLFSAGGNTRSALETLLIHTPNFFICYPERMDNYTGEIRADQKHIMWCPEESHKLPEENANLAGIMLRNYDEVITELELGVNFGEIGIPEHLLDNEFDTIEAKRTHTQMQIALVEIGRALNFKSWIARNDHYISYQNSTLGNFEGVIRSLQDAEVFYNNEIKEAASLVDCIWFTPDYRHIPAIIEVEHSTGVTSGFTRMRKLFDTMPSINTRYVIVAPNKMRNKVVSEANKDIYKALDANFMPYSTVRELFGLIQRYELKNVVNHSFVYPFMQRVLDD